ncbi:MAG: NUDIX domain-containing protein [Pseudomonadota bacterium]
MRHSAGLLMYRRIAGGTIEVLLAHPGGPYWRNKDAGAWTIPKGEFEAPEEALAAAQREFLEETGIAPQPPFEAIGEIRQKGGKRIQAWAFEGDADPAGLQSNEFEMEWPPRSGKLQRFPEVDAIAWFSPDEARLKMNPAQAEWLDRLAHALDSSVGKC